MNAVLGNGATYTKRRIMFEFTVGTRFYYKGKLCEVIERGDYHCSSCMFYCESACKNTICQEDLRRDHNWVLFKEVANGKKKEKL